MVPSQTGKSKGGLGWKQSLLWSDRVCLGGNRVEPSARAWVYTGALKRELAGELYLGHQYVGGGCSQGLGCGNPWGNLLNSSVLEIVPIKTG